MSIYSLFSLERVISTFPHLDWNLIFEFRFTSEIRQKIAIINQMIYN